MKDHRHCQKCGKISKELGRVSWTLRKGVGMIEKYPEGHVAVYWEHWPTTYL